MEEGEGRVPRKRKIAEGFSLERLIKFRDGGDISKRREWEKIEERKNVPAN